MRTYDPADCIRYVHLAQDPAGPPDASEQCHRLPAGYANAALGARLGAPRAADTRPSLVLLPGGPAEADAGRTGAAPGPVAPLQTRFRAPRSVTPAARPATERERAVAAPVAVPRA